MKSETVPRRVSTDIFCASSDLSSRSNACGYGTPTADFSASPNNGRSPETVRSQEYKKLVRFLIITIIIAFSISQPAFCMSGTWPRCVGTSKANDISGPNAKFTIISHGSKLPGFEIGEFS